MKYAQNINDNNDIITKNVIILIFCSAFTLANPLIYQIFLSQGPSEYLRMHFIVMVPAGIITYLIMIVAHSLLVILPKNVFYFSSAFTFAILVNVFLLGVLFFGESLFLKTYEINHPLTSIYYRLTVIAVSIMSINSIFNYYLIFSKKLFSILKINIITLILSIVGNTVCMLWLISEQRIIGFGIVKILVAIFTSIVFLYYIKPLVTINFSSPLLYFKRARKILFGDISSLIIILFSPSLIHLILIKYHYKEYISILGVAKTIFTFIIIPSGMLTMYATSSLSKYSNNLPKLNELIKKVKKSVWKINIYPAVLIFLFFIIFMDYFWNIYYPENMFIIIFGLSFLPTCFMVPYVVINRIFEKHINLARITFYVEVSSLLILFALSYFKILNLYLYSLILLSLSLFRFLLVRFEAKKLLISHSR